MSNTNQLANARFMRRMPAMRGTAKPISATPTMAGMRCSKAAFRGSKPAMVASPWEMRNESGPYGAGVSRHTHDT